jgi:hypothetical protein
VRHIVLTVKLPEDLFSDLEAYALQEFPADCRKCQGSGVDKKGRTCQHCDGTAVKGNLSEATRYLLHFALGQGASPEARAMAAAYSDFRSKFVGLLTQLMHRAENQMQKEVVAGMKAMIRHGH